MTSSLREWNIVMKWMCADWSSKCSSPLRIRWPNIFNSNVLDETLRCHTRWNLISPSKFKRFVSNDTQQHQGGKTNNPECHFVYLKYSCNVVFLATLGALFHIFFIKYRHTKSTRERGKVWRGFCLPLFWRRQNPLSRIRTSRSLEIPFELLVPNSWQNS